MKKRMIAASVIKLVRGKLNMGDPILMEANEG
jgi:hypothetical protein